MLRDSPLYLAALVLVLGGAFTKSAQFPFHFWLPNAMQAPTPVSAYLHSATMVKAGVYLLMRLNPAMGGTAAWETVLPLFGGATLIVGTVLALRQTDLKLMLAYTTVGSLGLLVMLTGFGSDRAVEAAVLYLIAHSLFKGALFMVAGSLDHEAGSRDITELAGFAAPCRSVSPRRCSPAPRWPDCRRFSASSPRRRSMPRSAFHGGWASVLTIVAIAGNALMVTIALTVALKPFLGVEMRSPKPAHEGPLLLWLGPLMLALLGLLAALFAGQTHHFLSSSMASAVAGTPDRDRHHDGSASRPAAGAVVP